MSQVELAAAMTVNHRIRLTQSDISEIERGVRGVRDYELRAFCQLLDVDPAELLELWSERLAASRAAKWPDST